MPCQNSIRCGTIRKPDQCGGRGTVAAGETLLHLGDARVEIARARHRTALNRRPRADLAPPRARREILVRLGVAHRLDASLRREPGARAAANGSTSPLCASRAARRPFDFHNSCRTRSRARPRPSAARSAHSAGRSRRPCRARRRSARAVGRAAPRSPDRAARESARSARRHQELRSSNCPLVEASNAKRPEDADNHDQRADDDAEAACAAPTASARRASLPRRTPSDSRAPGTSSPARRRARAMDNTRSRRTASARR